MTEFIVGHKIAILLIGALLGGVILYSRKQAAAAGGYAAGVPVDPYAAGSPSSGAGGFSVTPDALPTFAAGGLPGAPASDPPSGGGGGAPAAATVPDAVNNGAAVAAPPTADTTGPFDLTGGAVAPFDPSLAVASQNFVLVPGSSTGPGAGPSLAIPINGYFQNEQGYQRVTTPPQLAPGQLPTPGVAYAA